MKIQKIFVFINILFLFHKVKSLTTNSSTNVFHLNFYTYNINISSSFINKDQNPLNIWSYNEIYTIIPFGEEKKNLYALLTNDDFGLYLIEGFGTVNSEYNSSNSSSIKKSSNVIAYKSFHYGSQATENLYLINEKNEEIKIEDFQIVIAQNENQINNYFLKINDIKPEFSNDYDIHNITFSILGLQLTPTYRYEMLDNFVVQLKQKNYINNYYWSIEYNKNQKNDNFEDIVGNLTIGKLPECYNDNNIYSETKALPYSMALQWDFVFREIFFYSNNNSKIYVTQNATSMNAIIDFNYGLITATMDYYHLIKEQFFDYYLNNSICFESKTDVKDGFNRIYFYCDKKAFNDKAMIKFPDLLFYHDEFDYYYKINYTDLFKIYDDFVYFLIVFDGTKKIWRLGKIFLYNRKFYFNHDTKMIGFCSYLDEEEKKRIEEENNNISSIVLDIIIIIFLIIIIIYFASIITKYCIRKKHYQNNQIEYELDYDKQIND